MEPTTREGFEISTNARSAICVALHERLPRSRDSHCSRYQQKETGVSYGNFTQFTTAASHRKIVTSRTPAQHADILTPPELTKNTAGQPRLWIKARAQRRGMKCTCATPPAASLAHPTLNTSDFSRVSVSSKGGLNRVLDEPCTTRLLLTVLQVPTEAQRT